MHDAVAELGGETEFSLQIFDAHGIEHPVEVIAFMLQKHRMEPMGDALFRRPVKRRIRYSDVLVPLHPAE